MGNRCGHRQEDPDSAWKQQNKEMERNPMFKYVNFTTGGKLIDAYNEGGPLAVEKIAKTELPTYFYDGGEGAIITKLDYIKWLRHCEAKMTESTAWETKTDEELLREYKEDEFFTIEDHEACWDLSKRGGVGETPFHLLYLMYTPVSLEVAKILLRLYPKLALDYYEGKEYFGESALHIAVVYGDLEAVKLLVEKGAYVNLRARGRFFLPEDQKNGKTKETDYDGYAYYGEYPLAFAASLGHEDIYDYLIDHGADPDLQDSFGNTVLHMVVISDQVNMYKYCVRHMKKPAKTYIENNVKLTPLTLASKLGRHEIFKEMLELGSLEFWRYSNITCSTYPLLALDSIGPKGEANWNSALMIIINGDRDEHLEMLQGGVMRQLLDEKWKTFARKRFFQRLILAFLHLALISVAVYTRPATDFLAFTEPKDAVRFVCELLVCLFCGVTLAMEILEIGSQGILAFLKNCRHAPARTLFMVSCILILVCVPFRLTRLEIVEDILLIIAVPCSWSFLLFFARGYTLTGPMIVMTYEMLRTDMARFGLIYSIFMIHFSPGHPILHHRQYQYPFITHDELLKFKTCYIIMLSYRIVIITCKTFPLLTDKCLESVYLTGPFVTMIYKMCMGDLVRFGVIYLIFLIGFTQAFFFLFQASTDDQNQGFKNLGDTIMTLFQMTLGEFKYQDFNNTKYSWLTKAVFAVFMILVPILLLNMLIAMMGNTYQQVISKSEKEWRKQWAKIVVVLERGFTKKQLLNFQKEYSVRLTGAPSNELARYDPGVATERRALVVIKSSNKTIARMRKAAVNAWKKVGKEVIKQIKMHKRSGVAGPLELATVQKKKRRGSYNGPEDSSDDDKGHTFSNMLQQLAWEKDIDLTKGQTFLTDENVNVIEQATVRSPEHARAYNHVNNNSNSVGIPNGKPRTLNRQVKTPAGTPKQSPKTSHKKFSYNRVSPLSLSKVPVPTEDSGSDMEISKASSAGETMDPPSITETSISGISVHADDSVRYSAPFRTTTKLSWDVPKFDKASTKFDDEYPSQDESVGTKSTGSVGSESKGDKDSLVKVTSKEPSSYSKPSRSNPRRRSRKSKHKGHSDNSSTSSLINLSDCKESDL